MRIILRPAACSLRSTIFLSLRGSRFFAGIRLLGGLLGRLLGGCLEVAWTLLSNLMANRSEATREAWVATEKRGGGG